MAHAPDSCVVAAFVIYSCKYSLPCVSMFRLYDLMNTKHSAILRGVCFSVCGKAFDEVALGQWGGVLSLVFE